MYTQSFMHEFFIGIHIALLIWYKHDEFFFRLTKLHEPIQLGFCMHAVSWLFNKFSYSFDLSDSIHEQSYPFTVSSKSEPKF